jgi:hypothetical protein
MQAEVARDKVTRLRMAQAAQAAARLAQITQLDMLELPTRAAEVELVTVPPQVALAEMAM